MQDRLDSNGIYPVYIICMQLYFITVTVCFYILKLEGKNYLLHAYCSLMSQCQLDWHFSGVNSVNIAHTEPQIRLYEVINQQSLLLGPLRSVIESSCTAILCNSV